MRSIKNSLIFFLINIYGPISTIGKREVWAEVESFMTQNTNINYILGGDYNVIVDLAKKYGGIQVESKTQKEFKLWVGNNSLLDVRMINGKFTWNNRKIGNNFIVGKLDRFFFKGDLT